MWASTPPIVMDIGSMGSGNFEKGVVGAGVAPSASAGVTLPSPVMNMMRVSPGLPELNGVSAPEFVKIAGAESAIVMWVLAVGPPTVRTDNVAVPGETS